MTKAEQELFDEKIKGIKALIISHQDVEVEKNKLIMEKLNNIEVQTTKTNGRVTKHDEEIQCINTELMEYRMFKKYPKLFLYGGVAFLLVSTLLIITKFI